MNKNNIFFIDFETGGLNAYKDAVISCFIGHENVPGEYFEFYPQKKLYNYSALKINNFDLDSLYENGDSRELLLDYINDISKDRKYIVFCGWNVGFDIDFLLNIYKDKGLKIPCPFILLDLCEIAKEKIKKKDKRKKDDFGVEDHKLSTIYQEYYDNFDINKSHTADYDCMMVEKLYNKFNELGWLE